MAAEIAAFVFEKVFALVSDAVKKHVSYEAEEFLTKRRIKNELERSVLKVIGPLEQFLANEKISEVQQKLIIETCISELRPLIEEPSRIFEGSLDGEKIFQQLYKENQLPAAIQEEGLQESYRLLLPRIANMFCTYPPAIKAWQAEGWKEGFKRLDEIGGTLRDVSL